MTDNTILEIKKALEKATPGDWYLEEENDGDLVVMAPDLEVPGRSSSVFGFDPELYYSKEDAHLIANAPKWLRYLIGEVERLEKDKELSLTQIRGMDFAASGQPAMVFYEMLSQLFEQNGGKNFLTITLEKRDMSARYSVTIRNLNGEFSEAEKLGKMGKQVEELQKALERAKSSVLDIDNVVKTAVAHGETLHYLLLSDELTRIADAADQALCVNKKDAPHGNG